MPDPDSTTERESLLALSQELARLKARIDAALARAPQHVPVQAQPFVRPVCRFCAEPILNKRSDATYCDAPAWAKAHRQSYKQRQQG